MPRQKVGPVRLKDFRLKDYLPKQKVGPVKLKENAPTKQKVGPVKLKENAPTKQSVSPQKATIARAKAKSKGLSAADAQARDVRGYKSYHGFTAKKKKK